MKTTDKNKKVIEEKKEFKKSLLVLFELEGVSNNNLANLITNNFEYYLNQREKEVAEEIRGLRIKSSQGTDSEYFQDTNTKRDVFNYALEKASELIEQK